MRDANDMVFSINKPYPPIVVNHPNVRYVNLILPNYSGMVSEYTAISQYIYHGFRLLEDYPKVSKTIEGISRVEMHHLDILAKLIIKLGGDPKYCVIKKDKGYYWDAKFVNYGCTLKEMLEFDIEAEKLAIRNYKKTITQISDENIIKIIERIILDEQFHLKLFKDLYNEYVK